MRPPPVIPGALQAREGDPERRAEGASRHPSWIPFPALRAAGDDA
jgi:hypothetical protein